MLPGARTLVPIAMLSLVILTFVTDDTVNAAPRVAAAAMTPAAFALPPSDPLLTSINLSDGGSAPLLNGRRTAAPMAADLPGVEPTRVPATVPPTPVPVPVPSTPMSVAAGSPTPRLPATTPQPVVAPSTGVPAPTVPPTATCPSGWFCYPRLGIRGPIVPYTDCLGGSDLGTSIRSFMCLSPNYLMGHAYTSFGAITAWRAGDVVISAGRTFTITGAVTARSCDPPPLPLAPLSLQTSLSPSGCGAVLIVQAR